MWHSCFPPFHIILYRLVAAAVVEDSPDALASMQFTRREWQQLYALIEAQEHNLLKKDFGVQKCLSEGKDQLITDPALQRVKEQVQARWELKVDAAVITIVGRNPELESTKAISRQVEFFFSRDFPVVSVADVEIRPATRPELEGQAALFAGRDFESGILVGPYVGKQQFLRTFDYINENGHVEDRHSCIT